MLFQPPNVSLLDVPHIQQKRDGECLAACAAMVLQYYGQPRRYWRLRNILKIRRNVGTPFSSIKNLERIGISVAVQQYGTIEALYQATTLGWPVIASVQTGQLGYWDSDVRHAVVVVGLDPNSVYINDPQLETGPRQVAIGDFDLAWLEHDERYAILEP